MGIGDEAIPNPPLDAPAHGVALALHPAAIERLGDDGAVSAGSPPIKAEAVAGAYASRARRRGGAG
jgi:hypothetical protein